MRSFLFSKFLLAILCLIPFSVLAQTAYTIENIPNPKNGGSGYVSDPDDILNPADELALNQLISEMEDSTTAQLAVVIVQSIGTVNPKFFTTELFNHWGIGQADVDNGLLIFTVMDQRRTEFETGYGLEGVLPDVVCYRIGMQELVPEFKLGNYGQGLINAVKAIKLNLEDPAAAAEISSNRQPSYISGNSNRTDPLLGLFLTYLGIAFLISVVMLYLAERVLYGKEELYDKYHNLRNYYWGFLVFLIPIPYAFLYLFLKRKLKKLRTQPRYSRETGALLFLLSEEEEDPYLKKGQITEEEIGSVDYDVWVSEDKEEFLILRYKKRITKYKKCPKCGYLTYYHSHSRTISSPTYYSTGKKEIVHKCKSCTYKQRKTKTIPKLVKSSSSSGSSWSSGGSSFGGSSSFGGGSSGGGGAGVSW